MNANRDCGCVLNSEVGIHQSFDVLYYNMQYKSYGGQNYW